MTRAAENIPVIKTRKKVLTYDDYVALTPPDSGNYELHNGKIIVTIYVNTDGELLPTGIYKDKDVVKSQVLPGFKISVKEILEV